MDQKVHSPKLLLLEFFALLCDFSFVPNLTSNFQLPNYPAGRRGRQPCLESDKGGGGGFTLSLSLNF